MAKAAGGISGAQRRVRKKTSIGKSVRTKSMRGKNRIKKYRGQGR
jgi:hypothetical protein